MKIICDKCEFIIDKDKYINDVLVEEYDNIFGTFCPNCNHIIKPFKRPFNERQEKMEIKMEELREKMRDKLRKNLIFSRFEILDL